MKMVEVVDEIVTGIRVNVDLNVLDAEDKEWPHTLVGRGSSTYKLN